MTAARAEVFLDRINHTRLFLHSFLPRLCCSDALSCSRKWKWKWFHLLLSVSRVPLSPLFIGTFHFVSHREPRWCNPIPAHRRMQCFKAVLWKLYGSLGERRTGVMYASLENQCRVKQNMSCMLASLWINVHSVKKINWINTINSPQRCRISLRRSISNVQSLSSEK